MVSMPLRQFEHTCEYVCRQTLVWVDAKVCSKVSMGVCLCQGNVPLCMS